MKAKVLLWLVFCFAAHAQQAEVKEQPKAAPSNLIYVIGGVKQPLAIELNQEIDLLQALNEAGGAVYKKSIIHVYRLDGEHCCLNFRNRIIVKIDLVRLKKGEVDNLMLKPCDIIEVSNPPSKWRIHVVFNAEELRKMLESLPRVMAKPNKPLAKINVLYVPGDVKKPTPVIFDCDEIDLLQVIEQAGGPLDNRSEVRVQRQLADNKWATIKVDLAAIANGKAESVRLRSFDLVVVVSHTRKNRPAPKGTLIPVNMPVRVIR